MERYNLLFFKSILFIISFLKVLSMKKFNAKSSIIKHITQKISQILHFKGSNIICSKSDNILIFMDKSQRRIVKFDSNYLFKDINQNNFLFYQNKTYEIPANCIEVNSESEKKEYFITIINNDSYIEIIDFYNISNPFYNFRIFQKYEIEAQISSSLSFYDNINKKNYFIFITIIKNNNSFEIILIKYNLYKEQNKINMNFISKQNVNLQKEK